MLTCPTCGSVEENNAGFSIREPGTYRYDGKTFDCDCQRQLGLRWLYTLAGIPAQYMRLDWESDYQGSPNAQEMVQIYLDKFASFARSGMGIEFGGTGLGVGKTFAATHIGKELAKRGTKVLFVEFDDMVTQHQNDEILSEVAVLILDEVRIPPTERMTAWFMDRFESMMRDRTNWNRPTIITTNCPEEDLRETYPRAYSLLAAKQTRVDMGGVDARQGRIAQRNLEMVMNDETQPIT